MDGVQFEEGQVTSTCKSKPHTEAKAHKAKKEDYVEAQGLLTLSAHLQGLSSTCLT